MPNCSSGAAWWLAGQLAGVNCVSAPAEESLALNKVSLDKPLFLKKKTKNTRGIKVNNY